MSKPATKVHLIHLLGSLTYTGQGEVKALIEKPGPGIHANREKVQVKAGQGFTGDHDRKDFWKGGRIPGREVTMMASEVLNVLGADHLTVGDNIVSFGIDLSKLKAGDEIVVGKVRLRRSEKQHRPCSLFAKRISALAMEAVRETQTRGALFYVLTDGAIQVGEAILPE